MLIGKPSSEQGGFPQVSCPPRPTFWETRLGPFFEKYCLVLCVALVGIACVRIISTYEALSLTIDEPFHLACAIEYLTTHTFALDVENPPVARAVLAVGLYLTGMRPAGKSEARLEGLALLAQSKNFDRSVFLMRMGNLPFFLLACLVVAAWSWHSFGKPVAVLALGLFTLLPTALADAGLATTDMALGATVGAAFLAAVLWSERPTVLRALLLGACVALAFLSKSTAIGYVTISVALGLGCYVLTSWSGRQQWWKLAGQRAATLALAAFTTAILMWAAYWFSFGLVPSSHIIFRLGVPAPEYFRGLLAALAHDRRGHEAYLLGEYRWTGWWYYFPVALAVKTPIAFLILSALGLFVCLKHRAHTVYLLPVAFAAGILWPAMAGQIDIGIRHIEPIYLGLSIIAALGLVQLMQWSRTGIACALTAGVLVLWMALSVAVHHPDYLAYFNGFAGNHPENILVDSNYDWGQDLKFLAKRFHQLGVRQFSLASLDGAVGHYEFMELWYSLPTVWEVDDAVPSPGWNVISPTYAKSYRFELQKLGRPTVAQPWYEQIAPTEHVGVLRVYYISPDLRQHFIHQTHSIGPSDLTPAPAPAVR